MEIQKPVTLITRIVEATGRNRESAENFFEDIVYTMLQGQSERKIRRRLGGAGMEEQLADQVLEAARAEYDKFKDTVRLESKSSIDRKYMIAACIFAFLGAFQIGLAQIAPEYYRLSVIGTTFFVIISIYLFVRAFTGDGGNGRRQS